MPVVYKGEQDGGATGAVCRTLRSEALTPTWKPLPDSDPSCHPSYQYTLTMLKRADLTSLVV